MCEGGTDKATADDDQVIALVTRTIALRSGFTPDSSLHTIKIYLVAKQVGDLGL